MRARSNTIGQESTRRAIHGRSSWSASARPTRRTISSRSSTPRRRRGRPVTLAIKTRTRPTTPHLDCDFRRHHPSLHHRQSIWGARYNRMSEASSVAKIMIMIGIIFILVGALSPGAADACNAFASTVYTAPDIPEFNDPFVEDEFVTTQLTPDANSTIGEDAPTVVGCPANAYFMCLWNFTSGSYIELDTVETQFSVSMDMKALRPPREIVMVFLDVACYSTTNTSWAAFMMDEDGLIQYFFTGHCTPNTWRVTRERWEGLTAIDSIGYSTMFDEGNGTEILLGVGNQTA